MAVRYGFEPEEIEAITQELDARQKLMENIDQLSNELEQARHELLHHYTFKIIAKRYGRHEHTIWRLHKKLNFNQSEGST